jgi:hypothetical protein
MRKLIFNYQTENVYVFSAKKINLIFRELNGVMSMATNKIVKYAYEKLPITCDFTKELATGEKVLTSSTITVLNKSDVDVTDECVDDTFKMTDEGKLLFKIQAGSYEYSPYVIQVKSITNLSNQFQMNLTMEITQE